MSYKLVLGVGIFALGYSLSLPSLGLAKDAKKKPELVKVCAKECPDAKTNEAVLECAQKIEKNSSFRKTQCGIAHSNHEKAAGAHHDEHSHADGAGSH